MVNHGAYLAIRNRRYRAHIVAVRGMGELMQNQQRPAGPLAPMWESFQNFCAILAHIFSAIALVALAYFLNTWAILGFWGAIAPLIVSLIFLGGAWGITSFAKYLG